MSRYTQWLMRLENATPYADEAVCSKCKHGSWVRTKAFCTGRGRPRALLSKQWETTKPSFCPEYEPKEEA